MKKTIWTIALVLLFGCGKKPQTNEEKCNMYMPKKIFVYDGISVYRFVDDNGCVYFTNTNGNVEWETSHLNGKTTIKKKHQVMCNKIY